MQLLIFRHGIADTSGPDGSDASRPLTHEGVQRTMQAARGLTRIADRPQVILTSPKVRAVQTAALLAEVFELRPQTCEALGRQDVPAIVDHLRDRTENHLLLVGHEPTLSELIEWLLTGRPHHGFIEMKKAGCACVEVSLRPDEIAGHAQLLWLASPRTLRALSGVDSD